MKDPIQLRKDGKPITLIEYLLQRGAGAPGQRGARAVESQSQLAANARNTALPPLQTDLLAPEDPFGGPSDPWAYHPWMSNPVDIPPTRTIAHQNPQYGIPNIDEIALAMSQYYPQATGAPPMASSPQPQSEAQIMAEIQAMSGGPPVPAPPPEPMLAFGDVPLGDTLNIQAPRETWNQGNSPLPADLPTPAPSPMMRGNNTRIPNPPTSATGPQLPPAIAALPLRPPTDPFAPSPTQIGGAAPSAPSPLAGRGGPVSAAPPAPAPQPVPQAAVRRPPQGLLRRPAPEPAPQAPVMVPFAPDIPGAPQAAAMLQDFPLPPQSAPQPQAAPSPQPLRTSPQGTAANPPPSAGGPQKPSPPPKPGNQIPQHLKDQLLAEAIRLSQKRKLQPQAVQ